MRLIPFLLISFYTSLTLSGQPFREICPGPNTNGTLVDFENYRDTIFATGFFTRICGDEADHLAIWNNGSWESAPAGLTDPGHALAVIGDALYIARYEESIDSNWVQIYRDGKLSSLGEGVYLTTASGFSELPNIYDIVEYQGRIIACGEFDRVGSKQISGIMQWNGNEWEALGSGLEGNILNSAPVLFPHQLLVHERDLYVAGNFRYAGGQEVNGIAKWNGSSWESLGTGFNGTVYSMAIYNDELIVGGSFTSGDGRPIDRIAKWNGTGWESLPFEFSQPTPNDFIFVHTLKVYEGILYIAGGLKAIRYPNNTVDVCNGIVAYDGQHINTFNGGIPGNDIEAVIRTHDRQLLIGGGVIGKGYSGIADLPSSSRTLADVVQVNIWPNPFSSDLNMESNDQIARYEFLDGTGRQVKAGDYRDNLFLDLEPGIYILRLYMPDGSYISKKLVCTN